ncbi:MAG: ubiquinone/menaquinone biosynthesis C-methylase UbiE/esterase/lipase [Myxococcota bacterium]|jgi:ubiquinone/menaquinone biosynthesis C-methylase UbiE/esterase/lipase
MGFDDETFRGDRRVIHRIPVRGELTDVRLYMVDGRDRIQFDGSILDISLGGMFVTTRHNVDSTGRLCAEFKLPGGRRFITVEGVIVHNLRSDEYFKGQAFGIAFQGHTIGTRRALKKFISASLIRQIVHTIDPAGKIRVADPARILKIIQATANQHNPLTVIPVDANTELVSPIKTFDLTTITLALSAEPDSVLTPGRAVTVTFNLNYRSHRFRSELVAGGDGARIQLPTEMWLNDKRNVKRTPLPDSERERVEIQPPHRRGDTIAFDLIERTDGGFSFQVKPGAPFFFEGTPLGEVRVLRDTRVAVKDYATVRHVSVIPDSGGALKIGVELGRRQALVSISREEPLKPPGLKRRMDNAFRQTQYLITRAWRRFLPPETDPDAPLDVHKVTYQNSRGQKIVGLLNRTFTTKRKVPVVIIPTAFSRRKESTVGLALTLVDNFRRNVEHVAILRFDYTNTVGESHIDEENRSEGREYLNFSTSSTIDDVRSTFEFANNNKYFEPAEVILVSFSLNSLTARTLLADKSVSHPVTYWLAPMGVADAQDAVKNCSGDVDYVGNHKRGETQGAANILGSIVNMDNYCADLVELEAATLPEAKRAMSRIDVPVTWIIGKHDGWVDPDRVKQMLAVEGSDKREIRTVDAAHMPTRSEAAPYFNILTRLTFDHVHGRKIDATTPPLAEIERISNLEWASTPKQVLENQAEYWSEYLVGDGPVSNFDILLFAPEYPEILLQQARMLDLQPGHQVLDLGCGTGNFLNELLSKGRQFIPAGTLGFTLVDFSGAGLKAAGNKLAVSLKEHPQVSLDFVEVNLDLSRARVIQRWKAGEEPSFRELAGRIDGLSIEVADRFWAGYSKRLHHVLRGCSVGQDTRTWLQSQYQPSDVDIILDVNRAARYFGEDIQQDDLLNDVQPLDARFSDLRFERLGFGRNPDAMSLPFDSNSRDRVVLSLVLSYLSAPEEVLLDAFRVLRGGGRIVISSMRPDTESSLIYRRLVKRVQELPLSKIPTGVTAEQLLRSARTYAGTASSLVRLAEEGTFVFYARYDLRRLLEEAGFVNIETESGFGSPAQAWVATGTKP